MLFERRTAKDSVEYNPLVILDIDKVDEEELNRITEAIANFDYTHVGFLSPSGNGLKIIVKIDSKFSENQEAFKQVVNFYEKKLKIKVDKSGKDVMRLCFFLLIQRFFTIKKVKYLLLNLYLQNHCLEKKTKVFNC